MAPRLKRKRPGEGPAVVVTEAFQPYWAFGVPPASAAFGSGCGESESVFR